MIRDILKKWYFWLLLIVFVIIIPVILNSVYLFGFTNRIEVNTMINAGDAFQGYSAILSFIGSLFLGSIAIWQNKELMALQKSDSSKSETCYVLVQSRSETDVWEPDSDAYSQAFGQFVDYNWQVDQKNKIGMKIFNAGDSLLASMNIYYVNNASKKTSQIAAISIDITLAKNNTKMIDLPSPLASVDGLAFEFVSVYNMKTYGCCLLDSFSPSIFNVDSDFYGVSNFAIKRTLNEAKATPKY